MDKRGKYLILMLVILIIFFIMLIGSKDVNRVSCLSLTFDDGSDTHYATVYPLLKEKNFSATFFIIANMSGRVGNRILMNSKQIEELSDNGFEIGSHTLSHPFLTSLNEEEVERELKESKEMLEDKYEIVVSSLAFPYSDYNDKVLDIAKKYYITARAIYNKKPVGFFVNSLVLEKDTKSEEICEKIRYANENKLWLVLMFHDVSNYPGNWDTSIEDFKEILNCAEGSGIDIDSLQGCRGRVEV